MKLFLSLILFQFYLVPLVAQQKTKKILVEGNGPPIVLLAGGTQDMSVYTYHSKELSRNYKVIRMEHFNVEYAANGLQLPKNYSARIESEAIKYTLDSLKIKGPIVLAGHSYGGVIALDFALNHPEYLRLLVLSEPPVFDIASIKKVSPEGMKKMAELTKELTPTTLINEELLEKFRCGLLHCDTIFIRQHPQWATWLKQKDRLRGLSAVSDYKINLKKLHKFKKPVLLISGNETVAFHKKINQLLATELPVARIVNIPGDHAAPVISPDDFIKILNDFIIKGK